MKTKALILTALILLALIIIPSCEDSNSDITTGIDIEVVGIPVIYETDLTLDVDDVGALAVLHGMQSEGDVTILGVCYNEVHPLAPAAIDAINTYYNRGTIPIGIYNKSLANPDGSDYFSASRLAVMGGLHNDGFNFVRHNLVGHTQYVIENWPGTLVTTHIGGDMITGETLTSTTPANNPVRKAYELEWGVGPNNGRSSWDQVTTMYAIFGTEYFEEDWDGGGSLTNGYS